MSFLFDNYSQQDVEALYDNLIETLPAIIYLAKPEPPFATIHLQVNAKCLGYSADEWLSRSDFRTTILHPGDREWVLEKAGNLDNEQGIMTIEYRVYGKNGKVYWLQEASRLVFGKDKTPLCRQGVLIDITEKKIAELEREELVSKLQAALAEIRTLNGLIPICTYCSKVRNDKYYWQDLEKYMSEKLVTKFSNSICPDCFQNVKNRLSGITQKLQTHCDQHSLEPHP